MNNRFIPILLVINALLMLTIAIGVVQINGHVNDTKQLIVDKVEELSVEAIKERTDKVIFNVQSYADSLELDKKVKTMLNYLKPTGIN